MRYRAPNPLERHLEAAGQTHAGGDAGHFFLGAAFDLAHGVVVGGAVTDVPQFFLAGSVLAMCVGGARAHAFVRGGVAGRCRGAGRHRTGQLRDDPAVIVRGAGGAGIGAAGGLKTMIGSMRRMS